MFTAATQGVYNTVNAKNEHAASGEKIPPRAAGSPAMLVPVSTAKVLTTASLAVNPVIRAVEALQSPKPRGAKTGEINRPIWASILSALSATTLIRYQRSAKTK